MRLAAAFAIAAGLLASAPVAVAQTGAESSFTCPDDVAFAATAERTTFKSRGRDIEALLFRPIGRPNGAAIVLLHGAGGLREDLPRFEAHVGQWVSRGYTVMMPNYYDASRQSPRDNPLVMDRWQQVGDEAIAALAKLDGVDASRIGLWGFSLGGSLALDSVLEGGAAKALVMVGTPGRPGRGEPRTPILMLAGDADPDLSIASVRENERLLKARGIPITVDTYAADRHLLPPSGWCEAFAKSRAFFDANLLASAT